MYPADREAEIARLCFPRRHECASILRVSDRVGRWIPPLPLPAIRLPKRGNRRGEPEAETVPSKV
jgi:hypothetical protein